MRLFYGPGDDEDRFCGRCAACGREGILTEKLTGKHAGKFVCEYCYQK